MLTILYFFLCLVAAVYTLLIIVSLFGLFGLKKHPLISDDDSLPQITCIICAKDEIENMEDTCISLFDQDYPAEKVKYIIMDDRSTDGTSKLLDTLSEGRENMTVVHITHLPKGISPKKNALHIAIGMSKTDYIVTTDADCVHPVNWLRSLTSNCHPKMGIATGVTRYQKKSYKNNFEHLWQEAFSLEHLTYSLLNAGYIRLGIPINANGSNMIFRKDLYAHRNKDRDGVVSGDDFFIAQEAKKNGLTVEFDINLESVILTRPPETFSGTINQRSRWNSKILLSSPFVVFAGISVYIYYLATFLLPLAIIWDPVALWVWIGIYGAKILADSCCLIIGMLKVKLPYKLHYLLFLQLFHGIFTCYTSLRGTLCSFTWKGERYRTRIKKNEQ